MTEREKVARDLKEYIDRFDPCCTSDARDLLVLKCALDLLEEDPPRTFTVIDKQTGEYPDLWDIALKEDWAKDLCYCDMEGFAIEEDGTLILMDECGIHRYCPLDRFEVVWDA